MDLRFENNKANGLIAQAREHIEAFQSTGSVASLAEAKTAADQAVALTSAHEPLLQRTNLGKAFSSVASLLQAQQNKNATAAAAAKSALAAAYLGVSDEPPHHHKAFLATFNN